MNDSTERCQSMVKGKLGAAAASAPKGDPTGKYTLNGWGQTEADFAFFDLAQDKVELTSDGWCTEKIGDDPNVYEWWYFDIHNHDGTVITGMLSPQSAIGRVPRFGTPRAVCRIDVNRNNLQSNTLETFRIDQFTLRDGLLRGAVRRAHHAGRLQGAADQRQGKGQ
jgi:hypothetical protein